MEKNTFSPKDVIFALDIGTRSIIGTVGVIRDKKFTVICEKYQEHEERAMIDGQIHDINLVAKVVESVKRKIEAEIGIKLEQVSIAAAGRFLKTCEARADMELNGDQEIDKEIVRSLELSAVKSAEEEINKSTAGKLYCVGYSIKEYYLNSYVISNLLGHKGEQISCEVIATFLPRSVIDSLYTVMNKVDLKVMNLTLEPIAAIEAAVPKNLRLLNIALVDIGAGTSDIAISSKETISSYAMVPMAGDEVTEVIAQEYLVDFNSAEEIKRKIDVDDEITYVDVLGLENTIKSEAVKRLISPTVEKLAESISSKIVEINGGKSPSAVFLVGGGAHTPGLIPKIAIQLSIPEQRIAVKDRKSVQECVADNGLGSAGVTVLGIGLTAIRSLGNDFIDVELNGDTISLFNSHKHTVMDVLLQAGVNPNLLISKAGKNIRYTLNGKKRLAFGSVGQNAKISIDGENADLETEVEEGNQITVVFAQNGLDANPQVCDIISNIDSIDVTLDGKIVNIEPVCLVNNEEKSFIEKLNDGDEVEVFIPNTVEKFKKYVVKESKDLYINDKMLEDDFLLKEGMNIYTEEVEEIIQEENEVKSKLDENSIEKDETAVTEVVMEDEEKIKEKVEEEDNIEKQEESLNDVSIVVIVNKEEVHLVGKKEYVFVDVFNFIDFNLQVPQGNIVLMLNGKPAVYTEKLKNGDEIEIYWE